MTYLYGASVQGIQDFIFQTNELQDIAGASELVDWICKDAFKEMLENGCCGYDEANVVLAAAGNIKYLFDSKEACEEAVLHFPRKVMSAAPGITISQAVVAFDGDFRTAINELEAKLRAQRNRRAMPMTFGLLGINRSPQTGLPLQVFEGERKSIDAAKYAKRQRSNTRELAKKSFFGTSSEELLEHKDVCYEIEKMTATNDWIAVVHADGNGLGQVVQNIGSDKENFRRFSLLLDEATISAANAAYDAVKERFTRGENQPIPIRPVVLGGDDLTVILRGDLAIPYTEAFIRAFEENTKAGELGEIIKNGRVFTHGEGLTACAGVAFIKSSYPFYYGYELAEALCGVAKKQAKAGINATERPAPSCLMFHKVQDSFVTSYKDIVARELQPNDNTSFQYGAYYLDNAPQGMATMKQLQEWSKQLSGDAVQGVRSGIRRWLTLLCNNSEQANQHLERLKSINTKGEAHKLIETLTTPCERNGVNTYPAYDALAFHTIMTQQTQQPKAHNDHE